MGATLTEKNQGKLDNLVRLESEGTVSPEGQTFLDKVRQQFPDLLKKSPQKPTVFPFLGESTIRQTGPFTGFARKLLRLGVSELPQLAGMTAGGILGAGSGGVLGGPPGGTAGAVVGAGIGGAGGEALSQLLERAVGFKSLPAPETSGEAAGDILEVGLVGALSEIGGRFVIGAVQKSISPFGKKVAPVSGEAKELGVSLTPAQSVPSSGLLALTEGMTENVAFSRTIQRKFKEKTTNEVFVAAQKLGERIGQFESPEALGQAYNLGISNARGIFDGMAKGLYKQIDDTVGVAVVPTKRIVAFTDSILAKMEAIGPVLKAGDDAKVLINTLKGMKELPETLSYEDAHLLRSVLLNRIRRSSDLVSGRDIGATKKIAMIISEDMAAAAEATGGKEAIRLIKKTNEFYSRNIKIFNDSLVAKLSQKNPEEVAKIIWKKGAVTPAKEVRDVLLNSEFSSEIGGPAIWNRIRRRGYEDIIAKASQGEVPGTGQRVFNENTFAKLFEELGPDMQTILGGQQLADIKKFVRVTRAAKTSKLTRLSETQTGPFQTGIMLGILGGGGQLVAGGTPAAALVTGSLMFTSPAIVAKLMLSKTGIKLLTEGWKLPAASLEGAKLLARIVVIGRSDKKVLEPQEQ